MTGGPMQDLPFYGPRQPPNGMQAPGPSNGQFRFNNEAQRPPNIPHNQGQRNLEQLFGGLNTSQNQKPGSNSDVDTSNPKKSSEKLSVKFEGWRIRPGEDKAKKAGGSSSMPDWTSATLSEMMVEQDVLKSMVDEMKPKGSPIDQQDLLKRIVQREKVDEVVQQRREQEKNKNAIWHLACVLPKTGRKAGSKKDKEIKEIRVVLKCSTHEASVTSNKQSVTKPPNAEAHPDDGKAKNTAGFGFRDWDLGDLSKSRGPGGPGFGDWDLGGPPKTKGPRGLGFGDFDSFAKGKEPVDFGFDDFNPRVRDNGPLNRDLGGFGAPPKGSMMSSALPSRPAMQGFQTNMHTNPNTEQRPQVPGLHNSHMNMEDNFPPQQSQASGFQQVGLGLGNNFQQRAPPPPPPPPPQQQMPRPGMMPGDLPPMSQGAHAGLRQPQKANPGPGIHFVNSPPRMATPPVMINDRGHAARRPSPIEIHGPRRKDRDDRAGSRYERREYTDDSYSSDSSFIDDEEVFSARSTASYGTPMTSPRGSIASSRLSSQGKKGRHSEYHRRREAKHASPAHSRGKAYSRRDAAYGRNSVSDISEDEYSSRSSRKRRDRDRDGALEPSSESESEGERHPRPSLSRRGNRRSEDAEYRRNRNRDVDAPPRRTHRDDREPQRRDSHRRGERFHG